MKAAGLLLATLGTALLTGCASLQPDNATQVRELATQRWQALLARKWDTAYEFATPGFRNLRSADDYRVMRSSTLVRWESARVLRADCEPERCVVTIELKSRPLLPPFHTTPIESAIEEIWVKQDGRWWMHEKL